MKQILYIIAILMFGMGMFEVWNNNLASANLFVTLSFINKYNADRETN